MYARHGEQMLDRLNGIFAFAIWDTRAPGALPGPRPARREAALLRPARRRPLLRVGAQGAAQGPPGSVDPPRGARRVPDVPVGPGPGTRCSRACTSSRPGTAPATRTASWPCREYWDASFDVDDGVSEDAWAERVRDTAQTAIRRQMVSDVPLGSFLSGGLDSGAVVATMKAADEEGHELHRGLQRGGPRARDRARRPRLRAAPQQGARTSTTTSAILEPEIVDLLPKLVWHLDEPIADPAAITTYLICSAGSERLDRDPQRDGRRRDLRRLPAPPGGAADPARGPPPPRGSQSRCARRSTAA